MSPYGISSENEPEWAIRVDHEYIGWIWYGVSTRGSEWTQSQGSANRYLSKQAAEKAGQWLVESRRTVNAFEMVEIRNPRVSRI